MNFKYSALTLMLLFGLVLGSVSSRAQGTAFTYQGRLGSSGSPANGSYDFTFALYSDSNATAQVGNTLTNLNLGVTNGLFVVVLDFGAGTPGIFNGNALWLQLSVRTNGTTTGFTTLNPPQPVTAAPYAVTAANLTGALPAAQLTGTLPASVFPATLPPLNAANLTNLSLGAGVSNALDMISGLTNGGTLMPPGSAGTPTAYNQVAILNPPGDYFQASEPVPSIWINTYGFFTTPYYNSSPGSWLTESNVEAYIDWMGKYNLIKLLHIGGVVLDEGWATNYDANNQIQATSFFTGNSLATLAGYCHARGLKLGVWYALGAGDSHYSQVGTLIYPTNRICEDAIRVAGWGIDYLKGPALLDYQGGYLSNYEQSAALERQFIRTFIDNSSNHVQIYAGGTTGIFDPSYPAPAGSRPGLFQSDWVPWMSSWYAGSIPPDGVGDSVTQVTFTNHNGTLRHFYNAMLTAQNYTRSGHYACIDELPVYDGMQTNDEISWFNLCALVTSPVLYDGISCDPSPWLTNSVPVRLDYLTNNEIFALVQDPLCFVGQQTALVPAADGTNNSIWVKRLSNTPNQFVVLLNADTNDFAFTLSISNLLSGFPSADNTFTIYDPWTHAVVAGCTNTWTCNVVSNSAKGVIALPGIVTVPGDGSLGNQSVIANNVIANQFAGAFAGNGGGLSNLSAANLVAQETSVGVNYTVTAADSTVLVRIAEKTITLPTAVGIRGRQYTIKLTANGSCTVTNATGSQTIDGSLSYSLSAQYKYVTIQSDGVNWWIVANN